MEKLNDRKTALELELQHSAANHNAKVGALQLLQHIQKETQESTPDDIQVYLDNLKLKLDEEITQSIAHHNMLSGKFAEIQDLMKEPCCQPDVECGE